jgi:hypothetical protein
MHSWKVHFYPLHQLCPAHGQWLMDFGDNRHTTGRTGACGARLSTSGKSVRRSGTNVYPTTECSGSERIGVAGMSPGPYCVKIFHPSLAMELTPDANCPPTAGDEIMVGTWIKIQ